jgi:homoserine dehydrogenase
MAQLGQNKPVRIGMLGFGVVGTGAYRMLEANQAAIFRKVGVEIEIAKIGVRSLDKPRMIDADIMTTDLVSIVDDPTIDVVLELMGGLDPAGELVQRALKNGKHVVTANKELIAKEGAKLVRLAADQGLDLHFEAAVGGGIPLIQPLKHQLAGNDVLKMMGILNGTTNFILTKMTEEKADFAPTLAEAQALGYAEADPTADVDGYDVQYKLAIISSIAFGQEVKPEEIHREGIRSIQAEDINYADILGYVVKLLAIVDSLDGGRIAARVHPALVPKTHPLASVSGVFNALWVKGDFVGDLMFSGRGAGSDATGSAVVGDLIDVCRNIQLGGAGNSPTYDQPAKCAPMDGVSNPFYVRLHVQDKPLVLGKIATMFGERQVSLAAMEMRVIDSQNNHGEIVFLTHPCKESDFQAALKHIQDYEGVLSVKNWIRVVE